MDLDPDYLEQREAAERHLANSRKQRRETQTGNEPSERCYEYDSPLEAYLAENYAALHAMECELNTHKSDEDRQ